MFIRVSVDRNRTAAPSRVKAAHACDHQGAQLRHRLPASVKTEIGPAVETVRERARRPASGHLKIRPLYSGVSGQTSALDIQVWLIGWPAILRKSDFVAQRPAKFAAATTESSVLESRTSDAPSGRRIWRPQSHPNRSTQGWPYHTTELRKTPCAIMQILSLQELMNGSLRLHVAALRACACRKSVGGNAYEIAMSRSDRSRASIGKVMPLASHALVVVRSRTIRDRFAAGIP